MRLFDKKQKHQMAGLVALMVIGAALETASTMLLMAVIGVLVTPETMQTNKILNTLYKMLGMRHPMASTVPKPRHVVLSISKCAEPNED